MKPKQHRVSGVTVHLFVARIPDTCTVTEVKPPERDAYIRATSDERLRTERYAVWRLLEHALMRVDGVQMEDAALARDASGRWTSGVCELSLSHTQGAVALALSTHPVGVDIERADAVDACRMEHLAQRFLTDAERATLAPLTGQSRARQTLCLWTAKEASFKSRHLSTFSPSAIDASGTYSREILLDGVPFFVSAATDTDDAVEYILHVICNAEFL